MQRRFRGCLEYLGHPVLHTRSMPPYLRGMNYGKAYRQAFQMQEDLFKAVMDPKTLAKDKAACARARDVLADRRRIIRGRGTPKPIDGARPKRRTPSRGPAMPVG